MPTGYNEGGTVAGSQTPDIPQPTPPRPADGIPPGGPYSEARDAGISWLQGGPEAWARDNYIDPATGQLVNRSGGPSGLVPGNYGLQYQAMHDQAVWNYRQNLMQGGINYARGALGLLQSFRPGGGATLEAGQYNTLAGLQFQRAQMTQPMDLLGDYRRHENAQARRAANRAQERALAVQIAGIAVGAATGGLGYGAIAAGMGGIAAAAASRGSSGQSGDSSQMPSYSGQGSAPVTAGQLPPATPGAGVGGVGPARPGGSGFRTQSTVGTAPGQAAPQGAGGRQLAPGAMQGGGQPMGGVGGPTTTQQGGSGGPMGMGGPTVGADGNFTSLAYAANGAATLANPVQQLALTRSAAMLVESDPVLQGFSAAIDRRLAARYQGVA